jgi:N-acylglucosamine-6-phosphate 2-epimerase
VNLDALRGGLIVSVQAPGSLLNEPATIALLARVAEENGAVAVRIEGGARIGAVRRAVRIPVIGLVKREYPGFAPYITPTEREIAEVIAAGADIVAFDATGRARPHGHGTHALVHAIRAGGALPMADCATANDAREAVAAGAPIVASTLCGYTEETHDVPLPALELVRALAATGAFAIAEGGIGTPSDVRAAFTAGAAAVVVGTAITNVDARVRLFVRETKANEAP